MINEGVMVSDFEINRALQNALHQEETAQAESKLIKDGTWSTRLSSYEPMTVERLPHAGVIGYNLLFLVDEEGTEKRHYVNIYFTPVSGSKGLVPQSKLGAQLVNLVGMNEGDTFVDLLERAKYSNIMQRITVSAAKNGYKAKNWTQKFTAAPVV